VAAQAYTANLYAAEEAQETAEKALKAARKKHTAVEISWAAEKAAGKRAEAHASKTIAILTADWQAAEKAAEKATKKLEKKLEQADAQIVNLEAETKILIDEDTKTSHAAEVQAATDIANRFEADRDHWKKLHGILELHAAQVCSVPDPSLPFCFLSHTRRS
jgi:hypothetical protein